MGQFQGKLLSDEKSAAGPKPCSGIFHLSKLNDHFFLPFCCCCRSCSAAATAAAATATAAAAAAAASAAAAALAAAFARKRV